MNSRPELTVIVMAYNEQEGLEITVGELLETLTSLALEVVIVDDGSSDQTGPIGRQLAARHPSVTYHPHPRNLGLGGVYRTGFKLARGEWLTFLPADGELPPSNIPPFLDRREGHDLLLGTIPQRKVAWLAHVLTFFEKLLNRILFGYVPPFQGLFMVRVEALRSVKLYSQGRGWGVLMELFLRLLRQGRPWTNVPTTLRSRLGGESKVRNLPTVISNLIDLLRLRLYLWRS